VPLMLSGHCERLPPGRAGGRRQGTKGSRASFFFPKRYDSAPLVLLPHDDSMKPSLREGERGGGIFDDGRVPGISQSNRTTGTIATTMPEIPPERWRRIRFDKSKRYKIPALAGPPLLTGYKKLDIRQNRRYTFHILTLKEV